MQSERPKNLVKRHWKEIRPSNQRLTPSTGTAVSEAKVILPGRPELHMSGAAKFLGFLPVVTFGRNPIMLCFTRQDPRVLEELGDLSPLHLANPSPQPGRERLRHLVIGSTEGVRATINLLHGLTYAEQATWSQLIAIPPSGILITPQQGEVFSLLRRDRQID